MTMGEVVRGSIRRATLVATMAALTLTMSVAIAGGAELDQSSQSSEESVAPSTSVEWRGHEYAIDAAGRLTEDGVVTDALSKTANVTAVAVLDGVLIHQGGGTWWQWTGQADWTDIGPEPEGLEQPATPEPTPSTVPTPTPEPSSTSTPVSTDPAPAPPVPYARTVPMEGPVEVPADFAGLHSHRWPGGSSAAPTYDFGTVRSLNYNPQEQAGGVFWYAVNPAAGTYDWSTLDEWVETHYAAGKTLIYTVYGTPSWCASSSEPDSYNVPGGDSPPSDPACVQDFVQELVQRYNGDGVRRIAAIEIWNEPSFNGDPYWRGSAEQLATLGRTIYQAAKAADPGISVLWPSFVEWGEGVHVWDASMAYGGASDGAGGVGADWADAYAFHFYAYSLDMNPLMDTQESAAATVEALGRPDWPMYNTEMGFGDGFAADLSSEDIATTVKRWMILCAAYGNESAILYSHDGSNLGNPSQNSVVADALGEVNERLAGSTIREAGLLENGQVYVVFADNSTWVV